jgi:hypothetical protein
MIDGEAAFGWANFHHSTPEADPCKASAAAASATSGQE